MASINKVILVGHLAADPETRYMPDGTAVANFTVATSESWKDKTSGDKKELTEWNRCSVFGKLAEICSQYLKKGSMVFIEGKLQTRKWQDKDNQDRYTTEIKVSEMKMLGGRSESGEQSNQSGVYGGSSAPQQSSKGDKPNSGGKSGFDDMDDQIPF